MFITVFNLHPTFLLFDKKWLPWPVSLLKQFMNCLFLLLFIAFCVYLFLLHTHADNFITLIYQKFLRPSLYLELVLISSLLLTVDFLFRGVTRPPQHTHKTTTHLALQEGYQVLDNKEEAKPRCDSSTTVSWDPHQGPASLTHFVFMWHSYSHTHWLLLCVIIYCGLCFILEIQK